MYSLIISWLPLIKADDAVCLLLLYLPPFCSDNITKFAHSTAIPRDCLAITWYLNKGMMVYDFHIRKHHKLDIRRREDLEFRDDVCYRGRKWPLARKYCDKILIVSESVKLL
jgi:hypothetical protein